MKDITAIIVQNNDVLLQKSIDSFKKIKSRLESIIIIQSENSSFQIQHKWFERIRLVTIKNNDLGETLNTVINWVTKPYVLFLHESDYLTAKINDVLPDISDKKTIIGISHNYRNTLTHWPFLIPTKYLKQKGFASSWKLPFQEATVPAWLREIDNSSLVIKEGVVKQARKSGSANTMAKQQFIQKYQQPIIKTDSSSITVLMANYNMEMYIDTAIASCFAQTKQPEQVLVMDDGSTDHSLKQLKQWNNRERFFVSSKTNEGKAKALNALLPFVTSDFILEIDADDWLDPDAIAVINNYLSYLPDDVSVLYGNMRRWKQLHLELLFKGIAKGRTVNGMKDLLRYRFPLGPRIYRTSILQQTGGFPVIPFENGRLYEDVSVLIRLIKHSRFWYRDFTVYNIRDHPKSITQRNQSKWNEYIKWISKE